MMLTGAIGLLVPKVAGLAVDAVLVERSVEGLRAWIFGLIGLFVGSAALDFAEFYVLRATASRLLGDLRARLHGHLLTLTPAFFEKERVGELLSRLSNDVTADELRAAARALDFVDRLPQGFDTVVGERGVKLSTGERQRIAIARVLLKDPCIVVLDEATSALDAESEHAMQRAFARLFEGRTSLVIAHRLATVRRADRVIVLEAGRITEQGRHEELVRSSGTYQRLCELQMLA